MLINNCCVQASFLDAQSFRHGLRGDEVGMAVTEVPGRRCIYVLLVTRMNDLVVRGAVDRVVKAMCNQAIWPRKYKT